MRAARRYVPDVYIKLLEFFDGDERKVQAWFTTPNEPLFGGMRPIDVPISKLRETVEAALAENVKS